MNILAGIPKSNLIISCRQYHPMVGNMDKDTIIRKLREALPALPRLRVAYLYGSVLTRDDFRDLDIAFLIDDGSSGDNPAFASHAGTLLEEVLEFSHECDIKILNEQPVWFKYEIISTGIPLYVRNEEDRLDFETRVLVEYQDIKFTYDQFDAEYLARV